jgi:hypothetical protein
MEVCRDLLAAIGEVVVEAAKLEYALARLVAARWGWGEQQALAMIAKPGQVRKFVGNLAEAEPTWHSFCHLRRDAFAVLEDRHVIVHSLAVSVSDGEQEESGIEWWHASSGTTAAQPSVSDVEEHAFDICRCFSRAVRLIPEATGRLREFGTSDAPALPKLLPWQSQASDGS